MNKLESIKTTPGANPVDLFVAICLAATKDSDDATAMSELENLMEATFAEVAAFWQGLSPADHPSQSDITARVRLLVQAHGQATNVLKRRLLWNAFWNSLKPKFFGRGTSEMLWAKLDELEQPDITFLQTVIAGTDPAKSHVLRGGPVGDWRGDHRGNQLAIRASDPEAEYADRLSRAGLVDVEQSNKRNAVRLVSWIGLAPQVVDFVAP